MSVFHPIAHGIEVAIHAQQFGQELVNIIGFKNTATNPPNSAVIAAAQTIVSDFLPVMAPNQHNSVHYYSVVATNVSAPAAYQYQVDVNITGGLSGVAPLPQSVAAVVSMFAVRGKGRKGRNFIFGLIDAHVSGDNLVTDEIANIQEAYDTLPINPDIAGNQWAVLSRVHDSADAVLTYLVRPAVGVQKDRLPGHKKHKRRHV